MMFMRVILDTNVLIDALNDNFSYTWRIIDLILQDKIQAFASDKILKEYQLIMDRIGINDSDKEKLERFFSKIEMVHVTKRLSVIPDDPQDEKFVECADEANVDYVISSDRHLLNLSKYNNIKMIHPKDFWFEYQGKKPDADDEWKDLFRTILGK